VSRRKTFKKTGVFLICFSAIILAGFNVDQYLQIKGSKQGKSPGKNTENGTAGNIAQAGKAPLQQERSGIQPVKIRDSRTALDEASDLLYHLDAAKEELSVVKEHLAADKAKKAEQNKTEKEYQEKFWDNAANKATMFKVYDLQYVEIFQELNLPSDVTVRIKELLYEEDIALQELLLEYGESRDLTVKQLEEIRHRNSVIHEDLGTKVEKLLGVNDYAAYRKFMGTRVERDRVEEFTKYLNPKEALTGVQEKLLVKAMHEAAKQVEYEKAEDSANTQLKVDDEANIVRVLSNYTRTNNAYLKAATGMLSASQLKQFKAHLEEATERYRLRLEIQALENRDSNSQNSP
jgi:hypothetical protein